MLVLVEVDRVGVEGVTAAVVEVVVRATMEGEEVGDARERRVGAAATV